MNISSYFEINNRSLELQIGADKQSNEHRELPGGKVLAQVTERAGRAEIFSAADCADLLAHSHFQTIPTQIASKVTISFLSLAHPPSVHWSCRHNLPSYNMDNAQPNNAALFDARRRQQGSSSQLLDSIASGSNCTASCPPFRRPSLTCVI